MLRKLIVALCAAAGVLATQPASAALMQATYTGYIYTGVDYVGAFAPAGTDLSGERFEQYYLYDTNIGLQNFINNGVELIGGAQFGQPSSVLDAWVRVRGVTLHFSSAAASLISIGPTHVSHLVWGPEPPLNGGNLLQAALFPIVGPASLEQEFHATGSLIGGGLIQVIGGPVPGDPSTLLGIVTETVDITAAVPEPSAWTLLILGFGTTGWMVRRRRSTAVARPDRGYED